MIGAVFLALTGAEALYADMGHFGRQPVRISWYVLVGPALVLNYFGVIPTSPGAIVVTFPPTATVVGAGGSGSVLLAHLGLSGLVLDDPGGGYIPPAPAVTITPLFKALFPDGTDQVSPTAGWIGATCAMPPGSPGRCWRR